MTRNTQGELIAMKKHVIEQTLTKEIKCKDGAILLRMHEKAFSRLRRHYKLYGIQALIPDKPGPKEGSPPRNRTPEDIESIVCDLGWRQPFKSPVDLSEQLSDEYDILLDQSTVYRILKRKNLRYHLDYTPIPKKEPILYCKEYPGEELQLDASYPFGRIDDCSRYVFGIMCDRDSAANAIKLVDYIIERSPFPIKRIRVDNRYGKLLKWHCEEKGIELIENDAYSPTQNGKIERYHKTQKRKFFYSQCSFDDTKETLEYKLQLWLYYYNHKRKHTGYGMNKLTPVEKIIKYMFQELGNTQPKKVTLTLQSYKV